MSAGGYDTPHIPSIPRWDPRRPPGLAVSGYDRPVDPMSRRRSPSPGPRQYDRYVPPRPDPPFRDNAPNVYRPNNYRPDYSSTYYPRSPSPDAYGPPLRDPDVWIRGSSWRPPPPPELPDVWPERKPLSPSPTTLGHRSRNSRDDGPSRMFEPSETWKQTHVERPSRIDPPSADRFYDRRSRINLELPDKPIRTDRAPAFIPGGDRYRPAPKRDSFPPGRADTYRPAQDSGWPSHRREPISPANTQSHFRKNSGSFSHSRPVDRHSPYSAQSVTSKPAVSPPPRVVSPVHSPDSITPNPDNVPWTYSSSLDPAKREAPPRQPSRSSIASTHVSDRNSPLPSVEPVAASAPPIAVSTNVVGASKTLPKPISEAQKPLALAEDVRVESTRSETKDTPPPVLPTVKESTADVAVKPSVIAHAQELDGRVKESTVKVIQLPTPGPSLTNREPSGTPAVNGMLLATSETSSAPTKEPIPVVSAVERPLQQPIPVKPPTNVLEIAQPKPSPIPVELSLSDKNDAMDTDILIPPTTHSPSPSLSPEIPAATIPKARTPPPLQTTLPKPEDIPPFSEAKTKEEALRIVVMTRLLRDRQSREERVEPVLMANQAIAAPPEVHPTATPDTLLEKMYTGQCLKERMNSATATKPLLAMYLEQRRAMVDEKVARLREEYLTLHERWVARCNALNEQQKTLASEHENQHTGRTTRRSTAFTDAVRSDFEMEQIIASLGNDDATDPNHLSMRNLAKIPDMISAVNGKVDYLFDDTAGFVENPAEYFAPHTGIDDWTEEEKQIFIDKFAAFPKQFGIIADYIPHKTAAQCVDYYYLHKKMFIDFRRVVSQFAPNKRKRRGMGRKKGNGLLADIAIHDMEVGRAGTSASVSAPSPPTRAPRGRKPLGAAKGPASRRNAVQVENTPVSTPTPEPESRPRRGRPPHSAVSTLSKSATAKTATPTPVSTPAPSAPPSAAATPSASVPPVIQIPAAPILMTFINTSTPASASVSTAPTPAPPVEDDETPEREVETRPVKRAKRTRKIKSVAMISEEPGSPGPEPEISLPATNASSTSQAPTSRGGKKEKGALPSVQWSSEDQGKVVASAPKRSPTPDRWNELPFSAADPSASSMPTTLPVHAVPNQTPPMSSLSYDPSARSAYPLSGPSPYGANTSPRDVGVPQPWTVPPLPTRIHHTPVPPSPSTQPTSFIARNMTGNNPSMDNRRHSLYNSPPSRNGSYPYSNSTTSDPRGGYPSSSVGKYPEGSGPPPLPTRAPPPTQAGPRQSSPPNPTRSPKAPMKSPVLGRAQPSSTPSTPLYVTSSPPMPTNGRPGYVPPPLAPPVAGPNATPIVHSPTGMSPKLPPQTPQTPTRAPATVHPPAQNNPAHHISTYGGYPPPPPSGQYPYGESRPRSGSTSSAGGWGQARYYAPGPAPEGHWNRRRTDSGSSDGPPSIVRRDHGYPMYTHNAGTGGQGAPPSGGAATSSGFPGSIPAKQNLYYPGWT
ncbi:unnamed protein product [Cyclocybe aegerita]|uniref:SANT domain-containing protein n=1 Tax=Cyclocybe aegerita TaxID=1973307 RepID=A0A8S0VRP6_CYCAE|nr:unnamed protein product [Cyclocybe aegerita]